MTTCSVKWVMELEDSVLQQRQANSTICVARGFPETSPMHLP